MARPYALEMEQLADTFAWVRRFDIGALRKAVRAGSHQPLRAIGSGGSLTAAAALAGLHQALTGQLSSVATPLEAVDEVIALNVSQWLISAGGRNVDVLRAAQILISREPRQLGVICGRSTSPLAELCAAHHYVDLVIAPPPAGKDGFLATNSLLAFVGLLSRVYTTEFVDEAAWEALAANLAALLDGSDPAKGWRRETEALWSRPTTVVLHSTATRIGAIDIESKFTEAAIGNLQFADYRNFAHGRHHWLAKRGAVTGILAFITDADRTLAERTLALLPNEIPQARIEFQGNAIATNLASLIAALQVTGWAGAARGIDPGQPGVPEFGRKLYNLPLSRGRRARADRSLSDRVAAAVVRKAGVNLEALEKTGDLARWIEAHDAFRAQLTSAKYAGVVLDYDGTVVETRDRFEPPRASVSDQIVRLLDGGVQVGVATGRGRSVRVDLCRCIPAALHSRVLIGYYNGAQIATLDDEAAPDNSGLVCEALGSLADALARQPELASAARQENRPYQITLEAKRLMAETRLWDLVHQIILSTEAQVKVTRSSHSIDIVPLTVSKLDVLAALRMRTGLQRPVYLTVGDRGRWPGNDYELLRQPHSLSVDEVSIDPATCWNLAAPGQRGPQATLEYLTALRIEDGQASFAAEALA